MRRDRWCLITLGDDHRLLVLLKTSCVKHTYFGPVARTKPTR